MSWLFNLDQINSWAFAYNVFSPEECQKIIDYGNSQKKEIALIDSNSTDLSIRKNNIAWLSVNEDTKWFYDKIARITFSLNDQFFKFDLTGFVEDLQFTEYKCPDNEYKAHIDRSPYTAARKLSIVIQLSDPKDYEGGELEIITGHIPDIQEKKQGMIIAFPSYVLHKVNCVTKGTRYSLVGWTNGPNFK